MHSTPQTRAHAQDVLDYITAHPEKHNQSKFTYLVDRETGCGTTMCVAGTSNWLMHGKEAMNFLDQDEAIEFLGLGYDEAEVLFYEMSEERAVQKLKKIVVGEEFSKEDFFRVNGFDEAPEFQDCNWDSYSHVVDNHTFVW